MLESDGCSAVVEYTENAAFIRSSGWEPYLFKERRNAAGDQSAQIVRECKMSGVDRRQRIFIEVKSCSFGTSKVKMMRKECD